MNGINESWHTSNTQEWATPQKVFDELDAEFHFTLDPCCTHENAKCEKHYTIEDDGLSKSWGGEVVFCNPPYRDMSKWAMRRELYASCDFKDYEPRKGFKCKEYFKDGNQR